MAMGQMLGFGYNEKTFSYPDRLVALLSHVIFDNSNQLLLKLGAQLPCNTLETIPVKMSNDIYFL